jgi:acyl-CoA synthetase (NDP forming)
VIIVPASRVAGAMADAAGRAKVVQVVTSGFAESTTAGVAAQAELRDSAAAGDTILVGPNCIGAYCPSGRQTFMTGVPTDQGSIGAVLQSGGFAGDLIREGGARGLRFSKVLSLGNSADLGIAETVAYLLDDPATAVIGCYVENASEGWALRRVLLEALTSKPVVLLRGGRTASGGRAAASHTGALTGQQQFWTTLCTELGICEVTDFESFVDLLLMLNAYPAMDVGTASGTTAGAVVIGTGGGNSVAAADQLSMAGIELADLSDDTQAALGALGLPAGCSLSNPVDIGASQMLTHTPLGDVPTAVMKTIVDHQGAPSDLLIHFNTPHFPPAEASALSLEVLVDQIGALRAALPQTRVALALRGLLTSSAQSRAHDLIDRAGRGGVPVYQSIPGAAAALGRARALHLTRQATIKDDQP